MKDEILIRLLEETSDALRGVNFPVTTPNLIPSYNAILATAKANHPNDIFLKTLSPIYVPEDFPPSDGNNNNRHGRNGREGGSPEELRVLFGQLRIVLEALQEQEQQRPRYSPDQP